MKGVKSETKNSSNPSIARSARASRGLIDDCGVHHCLEEVRAELESFVSTFPHCGFWGGEVRGGAEAKRLSQNEVSVRMS